jgi:hypothetical protein
MTEDKIVINLHTKRIRINDGPEYIEFNPLDVGFAERYYSLVKNFKTKADEYSTRASALQAEMGVDDQGIPNNTADMIALVRESCEYINSEIDRIFGAGTSKKVFGDVLELEMFEQFFRGITPFINAARSERLAKYVKPEKTRIMK